VVNLLFLLVGGAVMDLQALPHVTACLFVHSPALVDKIEKNHVAL